MKNVLLTVLLFVVVLLLAMGTGQAGERALLDASPETVADTFMRGLAKRVSLTPQEHDAVRSIVAEQTAKRQSVARGRLAANPGLAGMMALRRDMRDITRETDTKLAAVLPPEKLTALQAYRDDVQRRARDKGLSWSQNG